jgi:predicted transcriptional regulator
MASRRGKGKAKEEEKSPPFSVRFSYSAKTRLDALAHLMHKPISGLLEEAFSTYWDGLSEPDREGAEAIAQTVEKRDKR